MKIKDMTTEQILNLLTKDELIQYFAFRYLISKENAVFIATQTLRDRQIRNLKRNQKRRENQKTRKLTTVEYLKIMHDFDKEDLEYDRLEKKINELEELLK